MRLSTGERPNRDDARRALHRALDQGLNLIDTASAYARDDGERGHNERLIAEVLGERGETDPVLVATKGGMTRPGGAWSPDGRPEAIRSDCEASLRALNVSEIPLYQLHAPDPRVPFQDSVGALAELRDAGKVVHVGLSNVDVDQIEAARAIVPIVAVQNRCSLLWGRDVVDGTLRHCRQRGILYLAYNPVGGRRRRHELLLDPTLQQMARRWRVSPHAIALRWLMELGEHVIPLCGATRIETITDCVTALGLAMPHHELARLTRGGPEAALDRYEK